MNSKFTAGILLAATLVGLAGCVTAPKPDTEGETAYTPPSQQPESSKDYWERRNREDNAAMQKSIAEGKGP
jgi:hypothetical protein